MYKRWALFHALIHIVTVTDRRVCHTRLIGKVKKRLWVRASSSSFPFLWAQLSPTPLFWSTSSRSLSYLPLTFLYLKLTSIFRAIHYSNLVLWRQILEEKGFWNKLSHLTTRPLFCPWDRNTLETPTNENLTCQPRCETVLAMNGFCRKVTNTRHII